MSLLTRIEWPLWLACGLAVLLNALAQISLQRANVQSLRDFSVWLQPSVLVAVLAYGLSFALSAWLSSHMSLSRLSPLMAGLIFLLLLAYDGLVLHQAISWQHGLGVIVVGVGLQLIVLADG